MLNYFWTYVSLYLKKTHLIEIVDMERKRYEQKLILFLRYVESLLVSRTELVTLFSVDVGTGTVHFSNQTSIYNDSSFIKRSSVEKAVQFANQFSFVARLINTVDMRMSIVMT